MQTNTALLVIDIINECCDQRCESNDTYNKIREMVPKLKQFISKFRKSGGQVIFVNSTPWTKKHLAKNIVELYKDPKCKYYSEGNEFNQKFYIKPQKQDFILTKNTYDAFSNPELDNYLKKKKINQILVTGVFGDGCVESTIQGAFSAGYNLIILKDLIQTTDSKIRQRLQELLKEYTWPTMFGKTINYEDL